MESTLVRVRRVEASAAPAVFVATRLIGALGQARRIDLDRADDDLIVLRVWPVADAGVDDGGPERLLAHVESVLRGGTFAGWESAPAE
jgi:hypothetical protein